MAASRPTMRQLREAKNTKLRAEMQVAIDEGWLTVRQMTRRERTESDAHHAAGAEARATRAALAASRGS
jgi:hypothetical protein